MTTQFRSENSFIIKGHGRVFTVFLSETVNDFTHLVGHTVTIDGDEFKCKAVERFAHCPPWGNKMIGLLVAE